MATESPQELLNLSKSNMSNMHEPGDDDAGGDDVPGMMYPEVKLQENDDATVVSDTNNNDDEDEEEIIDEEDENCSQHSIEVTPDIITDDVDTTQQLLSSLSSLMAMAANNSKRSSKLDKITERLTQRQLAGEQSLLQAFSPSSGQHSESNGTSGSNEDDDEDEESLRFAAQFAGNGDEKYKCPLCDLKLDSQHMFTLHIRSHNPSDHSNTCQLCNKTLSSASSLDRHMLIHSGERPFKCSICNMAFTTNGNMHRHMRTHGHGSIGYTPRGAKRRAKLFAEQARKVAAAAAAGERVDASTLSKLKKAAIEVTSGNGKSPISSEIKKLCRGRRGSESYDDSVPLNAIQTVYETKSIADAAAAFASAITQSDSKKSKSSTGLPSPPFSTFPLPSQDVNGMAAEPQKKSKPGRKRKNKASEPTTPMASSLQNAAMAALQQGLSTGDSIQCPICQATLNCKMDLHGHMLAFHRSDKLFCIDCGMILENYDVYVNHPCTFSAPRVMAALNQNPQMSKEALFPSSNTGRMNFSNLASMSGKSSLAGTPTQPSRGGRSSQIATPHILPQNSPSFNNNNNNNNNDLNTLIQTLQKQLQAQQNLTGVGLPMLPPKESTLMDLSKKNSLTGPAQCTSCSQRFTNARDLKRHFETYCHECNLDCGSNAVYVNHLASHGFDKFPALSKALTGAQQQQAAHQQQTAHQFMANILASHTNGLLGSMGHMTSPAQHLPAQLSSPLGKNPLANSLAASLSNALTASGTDQMPDLADIQSIISMANKGNELRNSASGAFNQADPISPNRASDAENAKVLKNGDASHHHPDSPASADSAGMAVGQSGSTGTGTDSGHESANTNEFACKDELFSFDDDDEPTAKRVKKEEHEEESLDLSVDGKSSSFRCEPCRLSFRSMNALKRHNRGHTAGGGHSHACDLCPYKSLDKSTLIRHSRTHNGERPFQCSICKYAFTTKANCERHVKKKHRDLDPSEIRQAMQFNEDMAATVAATRVVAEKIFIKRDELPTSQDTVCKQCNVDHGSNKELRAHLRVPNNPCSAELKPFVCTICGTGFNTRNNCVRHILKQHPEAIQVSDEEAAKVVAAVNGQIDTTAESLLRDDSSLSGSGSGSPTVDRSFNSVSCSSDEGEEYDEGVPLQPQCDDNDEKAPSPNASLDALFRVAGVEVAARKKSSSLTSPLAMNASTGPLNLSVSGGNNNSGKKSPLDLSKIKAELPQDQVALAATLSAATQPNFNAFFGTQDFFQNPSLAASLMALWRAENESQKQQQQHQQQQQLAAAAAVMNGFDMSVFTKSFSPAAGLFNAPAPAPTLPNFMPSTDETLAHLMAQFHQSQVPLKGLAKHH